MYVLLGNALQCIVLLLLHHAWSLEKISFIVVQQHIVSMNEYMQPFHLSISVER